MPDPTLTTETISKSFGIVRALIDVSIQQLPGEVHGIVGENGAGKSTLMKILSGVVRTDSRRILVRGEPVDLHDPAGTPGSTVILRKVNRNQACQRGLISLLLCLVLSFASAAPTTQPTSAATQATDEESPADAAVRKTLDQPLKISRYYNQKSLAKVIDELATLGQTRIDVDWDALTKAGIGHDAPVTARIHDMKFSKVLYYVFESVDGEDYDHRLGYRVVNGSVLISTLPGLSKFDVTNSYNVADLLDVPHKGDEAEHSDQLDEIKQYITDNVDRYSWKYNAGNVVGINQGQTRDILVITQSRENQIAIHELLAKLREFRKQELQGFPVPTRVP